MTHSRRDILTFLWPWLVGVVLLTAVPMGASLVLSITRVEGDLGLQSYTFVGAEHYRAMPAIDRQYELSPADPWYWHVMGGRPQDTRLVQSLYNSLYYTFFAVPLGLMVSLAMAMLLNRSAPGMSPVRAIVYLPNLLGGVATIVIWSWLFNPRFGWVNESIRFVYAVLDPLVGLVRAGGTDDWPVPRWLYSPTACKPAVILMHVWTAGGSMLIFLAALRRVPGELYDAVSLDGAAWWRRFRHVTLPMISPALLFNSVLGVITAMQAFGESYLLQNRAQNDGLLFYVHYLYRVAFEPPYRLGYACAMAWVLFAILSLVITPLLIGGRRLVYDALR